MDRKVIAARCHEIQIASRDKEISKFEAIPEIGMAVQLALRGCPEFCVNGASVSSSASFPQTGW
jgi:hypothetical protein